jgi:hypothetical protein
MSEIAVKISGDSEAEIFWDGKSRSLSTSGKKSSGTFNAAPGQHTYRIEVAGQPGDPWDGSVTDGTTTNQHKGEMDDQGRDTTGEVPFNVR